MLEINIPSDDISPSLLNVKIDISNSETAKYIDVLYLHEKASDFNYMTVTKIGRYSSEVTFETSEGRVVKNPVFMNTHFNQLLK